MTTQKTSPDRQILFESKNARLTLSLETAAPGQPLRREADAWEELYVFKESGAGSWDRTVECRYYCLPPDSATPFLGMTPDAQRLLRLVFRPLSSMQSSSPEFAKPLTELTTDQLQWSEIPSRRSGDPGGRVAELSRDPSGTRITSLMEGRPGWILDDHSHPSDVLAFCVHGGGTLGIGADKMAYEAGQLSVIRAETQHCFHTGPTGALLIVFVFEPQII
jgi:quercetin dioxygenase-like cupin family protein